MIKYTYPGCKCTVMLDELPYKRMQRKICIECRQKIDYDRRKRYREERKRRMNCEID